MRPPISSDSEDDYEGDYDGFSFGDEFDEEKKLKRDSKRNVSRWNSTIKSEDDLNKIKLTVKNGDLMGLKQELIKRYGSEQKIDYNAYCSDGWTLMLHAVSNLQLSVLSYLTFNGANVNCEASSVTPLMLLCKQEIYPSQVDDVINIAKFLLEQGAVVNSRDQTGYTPLMYACISGKKDIVDLLLSISAIDATNNFGYTALHYAVESRHKEIVKMLIDAGAEIELQNSSGLTPYKLAVSLDLTDIGNLFPTEIIDYIPVVAENQTYFDLVPLAFPEHKVSAYSQDIPRMLKGMRAEICAKQIYKANISLPEFLIIDDSRLQSIGIGFEYQRKRILHGLLKFHGHAFSPKSIELVLKHKNKNMYEYFEMHAGYLKHLNMMKSAIIYFWKIGATKNVREETIKLMLESVNSIQNDVISLQKYVEHLSSFSTKNPLFIGPSIVASQRHNNIFRSLLKYSIIGVGIVGICLGYKIVKTNNILS